MRAWETQAKLQALLADGSQRLPTMADIMTASQQYSNPRDRVLFLLTYLTAGRVSEVVSIRAEDIQPTYHEGREVITITMPNRKHRVRHSKVIPIAMDMPQEKALMEPVLEYAKGKTGLLLAREGRPGEGIKELRAWQIIGTAGFNPHWLRHIRLTHLETVYGLSGERLKVFAGWTDTRPAKNYMELNWGDVLNGIRGSSA